MNEQLGASCSFCNEVPDAVRRPDEKARLADRFLICAANWTANRYHSGQSRHGHTKLSQLARMGYSPGLVSWQHKRGPEERRLNASPRAKAPRIRLQR